MDTAVRPRPAVEARPRRPLRRRPLELLPVVVAVLPLVVPAVAIALRQPHIDWTDDRALTELAVREAARGHQLLGIGGRFGWRHPGPLWIYLLVPFYELSGRAPWSLAVGAIAIHAVMAAVAVEAARRAGGMRAAAVVALAIAAYLQATGLGYWTNLWAGYAYTWPMLALIVVGAVAAGKAEAGWAMGATALIGTLLIQTDVSTIVPMALTGATAAGLRVRRFGVRKLLASGSGVVLAGIAAAAWIPPLVQEVTTRPGNLTLLQRFARSGAGGHPLRQAFAVTGAALSVLPLGARWVLRNGVEARLGAGPWWAVLLVIASLAGLGVTTAVAWRKERRLAGDLAALTIAGVIAAVVAMSRVDGTVNFYLLTWITVLPAAGLAAVALTVRWHDLVTVGAVAAAAAVSLGVVVAQGTTEDWNRAGSRDVALMTALAAQTVPARRGALVDVHIMTTDTWIPAAGVALQFERGGDKIEVDQRWVFLFGDAFAPRRARPAAELWFARPHELPTVTGLDGVLELGTVDGVVVLARPG